MVVNPKARVGGIPAYGWVFLCALCWFIVLTLGPPEPLEPPDVLVLFREPILVKRVKNSLELVRKGEEKKTDVLWEIPLTVHPDAREVERLFGWHGKRLYFGLYRLHSKWTYPLQRMRFGRAPDEHEKKDMEIPEEDRARVREIVVQALNERFVGDDAGEHFIKLVDNGFEETSYLCVQNFALVIAYLSLFPAVVAAVSMVAKPAAETVSAPQEPTSAPPETPTEDKPLAVEKTP